MIFSFVLYQKRQIIKERRNTCVPKHYYKRLCDISIKRSCLVDLNVIEEKTNSIKA